MAGKRVVRIALALVALWGGLATAAVQEPLRAELDAALHEVDALLAGAAEARAAGEAEEARALLGAAIEHFREVLEGRAWSAELVVRSARLGDAGLALGDLRALETLWSAWCAHLERHRPADELELQRMRGNLGAVRFQLGDLEGARAMNESVLAALERALPPDHLDVQRARVNLAVNLRKLGEVERAFTLERAALEVLEARLAPGDRELQEARVNHAMTLKDRGEHERALELEERVLAILERGPDAEGSALQLARMNLSSTLAELGDLPRAIALQEAALSALSATLPPEHPLVLHARELRARSLLLLGDLRGARATFEELLERRRRTQSAAHPDLLDSMHTLAIVCAELGEPASAVALFEEILARRAPVFAPDHPQVLLAEQALLQAKAMLGAQEPEPEAEERILEQQLRVLGPDHPHVQSTRAQLARTRLRRGDHAGGRELLESALEVAERRHDERHPDLQEFRRALAAAIVLELANAPELDGEGARRAELELERAARLLESVARGQALLVREALLFGSAREALARCAKSSRSISDLLSLAAGQGLFAHRPSLHEAAFVLAERARAAGLAVALLRRDLEGDPELVRWRAEAQAASRELASLVRRGASDADYHRARSRRESAERALAALVRSSAGKSARLLDLELSDLGQRLEPGCAAIAFVRYEQRSFAGAPAAAEGGARRRVAHERPHLGAFVLRPARAEEGSPLAFVDLGAADEIESLVTAWRASLGLGGGRGVGAPLDPSAGERERGRALRERVWDPLLGALGDARRAILVPDDVLHLVPFDALPEGEGDELLGDARRIELRGALWELLVDSPPLEGERELVVLGGVDYGARAPSGEVQRASQGALRAGAPRDFEPLPATAAEARGVAELHRQAFAGSGEERVLSGSSATRSALESAAPRARCLHVATHGWFAPEAIPAWAQGAAQELGALPAARESSAAVVRGMSPMLLCGLALAGANFPADSAGRTLGLLTAEELSTLDLSRCELAVLSACDTSLGEQRAGQGVASLQQALHMAGARSAITSLWKVPDEATRELMLDFYRRLWIEKKPKHQALWEAKQRLREAKDDAGRPLYTTRDWAAWVLTGEPD